ncbi:MAG: N-acyl-D-amino-acid deacylase family protein [Bacillota bacterium]
MNLDLLIKNGTIVDGTGTPAFKGDLGVKDGVISAVIPASGDNPSKFDGSNCKRVLDAEGLVVCPGFIDIHSHTDWVLPLKDHPSIVKPLLEQGITTLVGGNCGFSPAPLVPNSENYDYIMSQLKRTVILSAQQMLDFQWTSMDSFMNYLEKSGIAMNLAMLTGHGVLRILLLGNRYSYPGKDKMNEMERIIASSFEDGSYGLSLGLGYEPGIFVEMRELEDLARLVKKHDRILTVHNKALSKISGAYPLKPFDEDHNIKSLGEMIELAEKTGIKIQISHLLFVGSKTWPGCDRALEMIDRARERGVDIAFDSFAHKAGNTTIYVVYPAWFLERIPKSFRSTLSRTRLRIEVFFMVRLLGFGLEDTQLLWGGLPELEKFNGMFFTDIAREMNCSVFDAYLKISEMSDGNATCLYHKYSGDENDESAYIKVLKHPLNTVETDALLSTRGVQNPAAFGTFPRVIQRYHKELKVISLEEAIAKMTGNSAKRIGLKNRGLLKAGNWADITIFDYNEIRDNTTPLRTEEKPSGIRHVFINGTEVVTDGNYTGGIKAGRVLRA